MKAFLTRYPSPILGTLCGLVGGISLAVGSLVLSPITAGVAVIGLIVVAVVFLFPWTGMVLTAFVVPIEKLGRFGDDLSLQSISLMRIVGILALGSVLLHIVIRRVRINFPLPLWIYSVYLALAVISCFYADDPRTTLWRTGTLLASLMFLFLIVNGVRDWDWARRLVFVWLFATILIAVYQVYDWYFGAAIEANELGNVGTRLSTTWNSLSEFNSIGAVRRATGTTSNAAVYGINLILTVPFLFFLLKMSNTWRSQGLYVGTILLIIYNILLVNTRSVMLFAGLTLVLCVLTELVHIRLKYAIFGVAAAAATLLVTPGEIYRRALNFTQYHIDSAGNLSNRFILWDAAWDAIADNWWSGIGVGNITTVLQYVNSSRIESDTQWIGVHNEFLNTLLELGIFGWLAFFGCIGSFLWFAFRASKLFRASPKHQEQYWFMVACQISMWMGVLFGVQVDVFHFPLKGWWLVAGLSCVMYGLANRIGSKETGDRPET